MCESTLSILGLKVEVDKVFHSTGLLDFIQVEAPTYERITLEFLSTLDCKLKKRELMARGTTIVLSRSFFLAKNKN